MSGDKGQGRSPVASALPREEQGGLPTPLLIGLGVVAIVVIAAMPWFQLIPLKQDLALKQQEITSARVKNEQLQQQVESIEQERRALNERVNTLRSQLTAKTDELGKLQDVQLRYDILKDEKARLEVQISQLREERDASKGRLTKLEETNEDLERLATRLRNRLTLLDRDYQHLAAQLAKLEHAPPNPPAPSVSPTGNSQTSTPPPSSAQSSHMPQVPNTDNSISATVTTSINAETIELPPIVVRKEAASARGFPIRARLVEVNDLHRFVVLSQGADDGVQMGMTFDLLRGNRTIGQAVAVRVRPKIAACDLLVSPSSASLQVGDLAIQRGP